MNQQEMVALIEGAFVRDEIGRVGGTWADFGAGSGNFTQALREMIGENALIYAVDRDKRDLAELKQRVSGEIEVIEADFTQPLDLPSLDGVMMANALHFVRDQRAVLCQIYEYINPGGRLILVEYDFKLPRPYVPHPIAQTRFKSLINEAGFGESAIVGARVSPSSGVTMYAGLARKPLNV